MAAISLHALTGWITEAALRHPGDLAALVSAQTGASRRSALNALRRLEAAGWLCQHGQGAKLRWAVGPMREVSRRYPLQQLDEDLPWIHDFAPCFDLPAPVRRMMQHAFCELLNNAVDHSGGDWVTVSMRQTSTHVQLLVSDNGLGLFDRVRESHAIGDVDLAMLELSKGQLTSQPARHSGRGLYFVARLADVFDLRANGAAYQRRDWTAGWHRVSPMARAGTSVYVSIALDTSRTLDQVMRGASSQDDASRFDATRVCVNLLASADVALDSRAQARRVAARLDRFRVAELDFQGVEDIGHGFADELFRVYARAHPGVDMRPVGMSPAVARMVQAVRAEALRA